jgi:hypothetical protein
MYTIRDSKGQMKARITDMFGDKLVCHSLGERKVVKYVDGTENVVFIMGENKVFEFSYGKIFVWEGDRIILNE